MKPFDIFNATLRFKDCDDMRPWLLVQQSGECWSCFPFASEDYGGGGFHISATHPDFGWTGLKKDCFILDASLYKVLPAQFGNQRGALGNDLLVEFRKHSGV